LTKTQKIATGIGAGALAAIIIAAIVFAILAAIGGKKGYDIYQNRKGPLTGANTNPLHDAQGREGTNPFFEGGGKD